MGKWTSTELTGASILSVPSSKRLVGTGYNFLRR